MTKGFCTIISLPYEGAVIIQYDRKRDAIQAYKEKAKLVARDTKGKVTEDSELLGVALVHVDIIEEKGDWY